MPVSYPRVFHAHAVAGAVALPGRGQSSKLTTPARRAQFKHGAFTLASEAGVPIVPLVIDGSTDCLTAGKGTTVALFNGGGWAVSIKAPPLATPWDLPLRRAQPGAACGVLRVPRDMLAPPPPFVLSGHAASLTPY